MDAQVKDSHVSPSWRRAPRTMSLQAFRCVCVCTNPYAWSSSCLYGLSAVRWFFPTWPSSLTLMPAWICRTLPSSPEIWWGCAFRMELCSSPFQSQVGNDSLLPKLYWLSAYYWSNNSIWFLRGERLQISTSQYLRVAINIDCTWNRSTKLLVF